MMKQYQCNGLSADPQGDVEEVLRTFDRNFLEGSDKITENYKNIFNYQALVYKSLS